MNTGIKKMTPNNLSIMSFYHSELSGNKAMEHATTPNSPPSDGLTSAEIKSVLPVLHRWCPRVEYQDTNIGALIPGPGCVALTGRLVNVYHQATPSKKPHAAKGCLKATIKDDTGALVVRFPEDLVT